MKKIYSRKLVGISIALTFFVLGITGIIMYLIPYSKMVASIHTLFGIVFIGAAIFHLKNNWKVLKTYSTENKRKSSFTPSKPFYIVAAISLLFLVGQLYALPPMDLIYQWGNSLRNSQQGVSANNNEYELIELPNAVGKTNIAIEAKKGASFKYPLFAVWLENTEGEYLQTLYVSNSIATSVFQYGKKEGDKWLPGILYRPEALPGWSHKSSHKGTPTEIKTDNKKSLSNIDAYSGATPSTNFIINSSIAQGGSSNVRIFFEVNQSFDWNKYYHESRFPEDSIYSGSGKVGQPALIYSAEIDLGKKGKKSYILEPVGHSHHSGKTGELYPDLSNITTALEIIDRVIVTVH